MTRSRHSGRLLADERRHGRLAVWMLWGRAMADAVGTGKRERANDSRASGVWGDALGDMRYVWRSWRRGPGFALTVVATLTVGLGLAVAIFTFADGYLFRALPFPSPDQLYGLRDPASQPSLLHEVDVRGAAREPAWRRLDSWTGRPAA